MTDRVPRNKLSEAERQQILALCNSPEFASAYSGEDERSFRRNVNALFPNAP